ncbi:MAG: TetR family transcriptional regulator [Brucellaceae bacterium]|nr:TetR family transcriptional regulator [Brucellaceae bacterium]
MTLAEIAKKAGVSRQAIYLFFGGRGRLLQAMTSGRIRRPE